MGNRHRFEIPELFPQPKQLELGEGISELAVDVRLATTNVWPIQRKALRSILTMGGVRVVANKKKYIVDARVIEDDPEAFNLSDVPEPCRRDYYELRVQGSEVFVRSPYQEGMVWAAQTLACLFRLMINGIAVPNLFLRDWPTLPLRGVVMDCDWWTVHMTNTDWFTLIDSMSQFKLNLLGVSVYDCMQANPSHSKAPVEEYLLLPLSNPADPADPKTLVNSRYYNAKFDRWYAHNTPPAVYENDSFGDVIAYGNERGLTVYPCVKLSALATILPKAFPELSARNAKGKPSGKGICISSPSARTALTKVMTSIVEKYYPTGVDYFQIGVDTLIDDDAIGTRCQCSKCRSDEKSRTLLEFLDFIIHELLGKGVKKVILDAEMLGENAKKLKEAVNALLKKDGIKGHLVIKWQGEPSGKNCRLHLPTLSKIADTETWISAIGYLTQHNCDSCAVADSLVLETLKNKADAALLKLQFDPAYMAMFAILGVRCWETTDDDETMETLLERWASIYWDNASADLIEVRHELLELASSPLHMMCMAGAGYAAYGNEDCVEQFPLSALTVLEKNGKDTIKQLEELAKRAEAALETVNGYIDNRHWNDLQRMSLQSLIANAAIIKVNVRFMILLLTLHKTGVKTDTAKILEAARSEMISNFLVIESNLPDWTVPGVMQRMGCNKLFLEQLIGEIKNGVKGAKLHWTLPDDWQAPEDK